MRMYVVQTAASEGFAPRPDPAREGRAAAMSRRRALASGRSALAPAHQPVRTESRAAERRAPAVAVDATPSAGLGRALSIQRRRQLTQGKQAVNGAGAQVFILHPRGGR